MSCNKALFIGNSGIGDHMCYIGIVRDLAKKYDVVVVGCTNASYDQVKQFYKEKNIFIYKFEDHHMTLNSYYFTMTRLIGVFDLYAVGHYGGISFNQMTYIKVKQTGEKIMAIYDFPYSYYDDLGYPRIVTDKLLRNIDFICPKETIQKYDELKKYGNYAVIHEESSNADLDIVGREHIDIDKMLCIDINKNRYQKGHKYYDIADKFVNLHCILEYRELLENAKEIYLIDSCLHALSLLVDLKATKKVCYTKQTDFYYAMDKYEYKQVYYHNQRIDKKIVVDENYNGNRMNKRMQTHGIPNN